MEKVMEAIIAHPHGPMKLIEDLVEWLRPTKKETSEDAIERFKELHKAMQYDAKFSFALGSLITKNFADLSYIRIFTEAGIPSNESFFIQTRNLIFNRILPPVEDRNDVMFWLRRVFWHKDDWIWVKAIPNDLWAEVFSLAGMKEIYQLKPNNHFLNQVLNAIQVVSLRVNALGTVPDIIEKAPKLESFESPFMEQYREMSLYLKSYMQEGFDRSSDNNDFKHINVLLGQCLDYVESMRRRKKLFGVSFRLTNYIVRLRRNLIRLQFLLYLVTAHEDDFPFQEEVHLFEDIIKAEGESRSLGHHIEEHLGLLSYQITENTGMTGEKYISTTPRDYLKMFVSACQGGLIVGFLCIFKTLIYYMSLPLFGGAFMYSMNYSIGFMMIHITHGKLATKQPAMTASRLASALDPKEETVSSELDEIAKMIKYIFRSQFIAFVGNVLVSFPTAVLIGYLYFFATDSHLLGPDKAWVYIDELHPIWSPALFHAAIAGVFLFLSGLITGYYDNFAVTAKIPARLRNYRPLRKLLGPKTVLVFSQYMEKNLGQLAGNFYLGIFLGSAGTLGVILGLPIDIRHITFAAGNFGLALISLDFSVTQPVLINTFLGIMGIGVMNFIFSFTPSLLVALKSRRVSFTDGGSLVLKVAKLFLSSPFSFFLPIGMDAPPAEEEKQPEPRQH